LLSIFVNVTAIVYIIQILYTYKLERTVNTRASCTGGLEFKSQTGQILHSVANGLPPLQHRK